MKSSKTQPQDATEALLETVGEHIDEGAKKMNRKELRESEKRFNDVLDRAVAARKSRRETA